MARRYLPSPPRRVSTALRGSCRSCSRSFLSISFGKSSGAGDDAPLLQPRVVPTFPPNFSRVPGMNPAGNPMNSMDITSLVACALLLGAVIVFIFTVRPDAYDSAPHRTKLDQLLERRDAIYENLRDLR